MKYVVSVMFRKISPLVITARSESKGNFFDGISLLAVIPGGLKMLLMTPKA